MTTTISLAVPALTDNTIAFANAAAWNTYWNNISGTVDFDAITTTAYTPSPYDSALTPHDLTIGADRYIFPTQSMFESLRAQLAAIDASYQTLRGELYAAGLISNP